MSFRVLLGNDPRAYRDALAFALGHLRPHLHIRITSPRTLDDTISRFVPQLVVCSRVTERIATSVPSWIVLHPGRTTAAIGRSHGTYVQIDHVDLEQLVELIDRAEAGRPARAAPSHVGIHEI